MVKEMVWTRSEAVEPEPEFPPVEVEELIGDGTWKVHDQIYMDSWSFGTVQESTKTVKYVTGYNTLTFKVTSRWEDEMFPKTFKLFIDGVYYEYNELNGLKNTES